MQLIYKTHPPCMPRTKVTPTRASLLARKPRRQLATKSAFKSQRGGGAKKLFALSVAGQTSTTTKSRKRRPRSLNCPSQPPPSSRKRKANSDNEVEYRPHQRSPGKRGSQVVAAAAGEVTVQTTQFKKQRRVPPSSN